MNKRPGLYAALLLLGCLGSPSAADAFNVRIKDITTVEGERTNILYGMGLVNGLKATGGRSPVTRQFATNFLQKMGQRVDPLERLAVANNTQLKTDNMSVVTVLAELPISARLGSPIDVTVAAYDDASSLQGGVLLPTPLYGADAQVYAVAAGTLTLGGFTFEGAGERVQQNHPTTGRIPRGATVEKEVLARPPSGPSFRLLLKQADAQTSSRIARAINEIHPGSAYPVDSGSVRVLVPRDRLFDIVRFRSEVRSLLVEPDTPARVVINERTGTVVVGENVRLSAVAITHGNLQVRTTESPLVSQPAPLSDGQTVVVPRTDITVQEGSRQLHSIPATTTVSDLADALNALGVTGRDLASIFQTLATAQALHAELVVQ